MNRWLSVVALLLVGGAILALALGPEPNEEPRAVTEATRVVSLGPSFTEIMLFLGQGDRLVGVTDFCQGVPAEVTRVGAFTPDLEAILRLEPDCVLGVASVGQANLFEDLRRLGLPVEVLGGDSLADVRAAVERIGTLVDAQARASEFVRALDQRLAVPPPGVDAPHAAFVIHHGPMFVAGRKSFVHGMLLAAGWRNTFSEFDQAWVQIEAEQMVQRQPDAIVDTTIGSAAGAGHQVWDPFTPHLEAVRAGRVYSFPAVTPGVQIPGWIDRLVQIRESMLIPGEATLDGSGKLKPG